MSTSWTRYVPSSDEIEADPGSSSRPIETREFGDLILVIMERSHYYEWEIVLDRLGGASLREGTSYDNQTTGISARDSAIMDVEQAARRLFGGDPEPSSSSLEAARKEGFEAGVKEGVRATASHLERRARFLREKADTLMRLSSDIYVEADEICDRARSSRGSDEG